MRKIKQLVILLMAFGAFATANAQTDLKILSLNMWSVPVQREMVFARTEAVGKVLAQKEYDLILFQEVFTNGVRASLLYHIGTGYYNNLFQRAPVGKLNSGIYNMSRYKILKSSFMPYNICGGIQCKAKKGIMYMQVLLDNGIKVDVFNHHTQAYSHNDGIRKLQLLQLKEFIKSKNNSSIPVVIAGDFNVDGNVAEYSILKEIFPNMKDVWHEKYPNKQGNTWDPIKNYWASIDADATRVPERLDYILIRDGNKHKWKINDVEVTFKEELPWYGENDFAQYVLVSDHYGVKADLSLVKK